MIIKETEFKGLILIEPDVYKDERGYFFETFNKKRFADNGIDCDFVQDNESLSSKNVIRGLHFQMPPFAQAKLVRVTAGSVIDVVVDIRTKSDTFGRYFSVKLDSTDKKMLFIPVGFAHGFKVLEENTVFSYKCSNFYNCESERTILFNDRTLNIEWNIENPVLSQKDIENGFFFSDFVSPF